MFLWTLRQRKFSFSGGSKTDEEVVAEAVFPPRNLENRTLAVFLVIILYTLGDFELPFELPGMFTIFRKSFVILSDTFYLPKLSLT